VSALLAEVNHVDVEALESFGIVRVYRNGDIPRDNLRAVQIVGGDGLAEPPVFDSCREAEDSVRGLRRRADFRAYDYLVEEVVGRACPG